MSEAHLLKQALRAVLSGQQRAAADHHRPAWHLAPPVGLMNDPNGFIHFNQRYVLCYQWNPLACAHGAKFWASGVRRIWSTGGMNRWRWRLPNPMKATAVTPAARSITRG
ncbi:hypothetical protein ERHA55_22630 [Erwinia rhapontici]|nr:hypothetical protein ERHA55_22630 [Erwinia rhapontici]